MIKTKRDFPIHTCPIGLGDWVKTANLLPTGVILDKADLARDIDLALFLCHLSLFVGDGLRTETTAVANDMLSFTKEGRVAVKINLAVLLLVPLGIEKQILRVQQLLNLLCIESSAIGNCLAFC